VEPSVRCGPHDGRRLVVRDPRLLTARRINGGQYFDVPRGHYLADLAADESLDEVVYIAMDLPVLVNSDELSALNDLSARGARVLNITNGPAFHEIGADLMNPAVRGLGGELGQEDGHRHVTELRDLLRG
jgi:hypothetical protein